MERLEKADSAVTIKTLHAPLGLASGEKAKTILYIHEPGRAGTVQYRVPHDFRLEPYVFDNTVPVGPIEEVDEKTIGDLIQIEPSSLVIQKLGLLIANFITAHLLQPITPSNRDFLKRLDKILTEIARPEIVTSENSAAYRAGGQG